MKKATIETMRRHFTTAFPSHPVQQWSDRQIEEVTYGITWLLGCGVVIGIIITLIIVQLTG